MKNVFVMGLDPFHLKLLEEIEADEDYQFLTLYEESEVVHPPDLQYPSIDDMVAHARELFERFPDEVHGVMGYWDLPTSLAVPVIAGETGLPGAPVEAVARCEHKYWSRVEQEKVVPEMVPRFQAVNPFDDDPVGSITMDYPFWIKPVKAHSSFLGYYIDSPETLESHLPRIRDNIWIMARPLNEFLAYMDVPDDIAPIDGYHCIAEEILSKGFQCTLEGYCWQDEVTIFGVIDSIRSGKHNSCFSRYQYPSKLPENVQQRMIEAADRIMRHFGYDGAAFNIEFYWDSDSDRIRLLEINARISKSHSPMFLMVDGATNLKVPLELSVGKRPDFPHRQGNHKLCGKFMLRYFEDGLIERVPTEEDIAAVREKYPEAMVRVHATQGTNLSDLSLQDSYSYELADIFLGADRQKELLDKYEDVLQLLNFRIGSPGSEVA